MNVIGKRYQIIDLNDEILVDDNVISIKSYRRQNNEQKFDERVLISFDDEYFFNLESKDLIYKIIDENVNFEKIKFDINKFIKYKIDSWHKITFEDKAIDDTVVIYKDNNINALDPEVKEIVNSINKLPYIRTFTSCSGHGEKPLYVGVSVSNIKLLKILFNFIYGNEYLKLRLITNVQCVNQCDNINDFRCLLETLTVGEKAYRDANKLKDKIEEYLTNCLIPLQKEISILKNTLKKINDVAIIENEEDKKNIEIKIVFYEKKVLDAILKILWDDFKDDFILRTDKYVQYIENEEKKIGTCFTLEIEFENKDIIKKVQCLNDTLINNQII